MGKRRIKSSVVGVLLPRDFDTRFYDRVGGRVAAMPTRPPHKWEQFGPSWSAVAYRFASAAAADDQLSNSLAKYGPHPVPQQRLRQEIAIFAFLTSACATVESYAYALFSLGWILEPESFPLGTSNDRQAVSLSGTARGFRRQFGGDNLTILLDALSRDSEWQELATWRNVATHQVAPGRLIRPGAATDWRVGLHRGRSPEVSEITRPKRQWLAATLDGFFPETDAFLTRRGVPG